ncbi:hypothetical protein J5N97_003523 [Dioscorea zingiberensis]|uniref:Uncharacterized protein n=1 Tax=Dioscorea zingiberensis TaxID=325984 RepID=A0A9D5D6B1_9LILI|nr:hypothetical protein J5N97_003523 [Dioscorea zingiberensis]
MNSRQANGKFRRHITTLFRIPPKRFPDLQLATIAPDLRLDLIFPWVKLQISISGGFESGFGVIFCTSGYQT